MDSDPARFLAGLVDAIADAEPRLASGLAELIESNSGHALEPVLEQLLLEIETLEQELTLFLDDWHRVESPETARLLQQLLMDMPECLSVVIASRSRSGLPLARLRVQDELVEINAASLRFAYDEARALLAEVKTLDLQDDDLLALWRSTEGWAAALQLAAISLRRSGERERILQWASGMPSDIGEYLAENVLNGLPPELHEFLLKTSILERFDADLCRAVTGHPACAERLEQLEKQELFLVPLDEERRWFRYHHLFARFLQRRLQREWPDQPAQLHRAAAEWLANQDQLPEALGHALAAGAVDWAIERVEHAAMTLVQHSYMATLRGLVARLPRPPLADRPALQMAIGWAACLTHHPQEAGAALEQVLRVAAVAPVEQARLLRGEADVIRACMAVYGDRTDGLEALVQPCLDDAAAYSPWIVGVAANILSYRYLRSQRAEKVAPLQQWARQHQDRADGLFSGVYGRCFCGIAATRSGDLSLARRQFSDAMMLARRSAGPQSNAARLAGALMGQLQYEANQIDEAERLLHDSRMLGAEGGVVDFYQATFIAGCRILLLRGDWTAAAQLLEEGRATAAQLDLARLTVAIACEELRFKLLLGDTRSAEQILADLERRCAAPTVHGDVADAEPREWLLLARARVLVARGDAQLAVPLLRTAAERARSAGDCYPAVLALIQLSLALEAAGEAALAGETLAQAIVEGVPRGMLRSFLDEGPPLMALLERLREAARRAPSGLENAAAFDASAQRLFLASRDGSSGLPPLCATAATVAAAVASPALLKDREVDILGLLEQGRANKEIARTLGISVETVKWYLKGIFSKLGVSRRTQAIAEARRLQLLN